MKIEHYPVFANEVVRYLRCAPGSIIADGTVGSGGHAQAILEAVAPHGTLIGLDRDPGQIKRAALRLRRWGSRVILVHNSYDRLPSILDELGRPKVDGILLDLGVALEQLQDPGRGMSFRFDAPLDLRFDPTEAIPTAAEFLERSSETEIARIFREYGELSRARAVARAIIKARQRGEGPATVGQLERVVGGLLGHTRSHHPLTLALQALRIAVNGELERIASALPLAVDRLNIGGRIAVISYHSLEDRIVKRSFRTMSADCLCPKEFPVCRCDHKRILSLLTKKPVMATPEVVAEHITARSAKLRVGERL